MHRCRAARCSAHPPATAPDRKATNVSRDCRIPPFWNQRMHHTASKSHTVCLQRHGSPRNEQHRARHGPCRRAAGVGPACGATGTRGCARRQAHRPGHRGFENTHQRGQDLRMCVVLKRTGKPPGLRPAAAKIMHTFRYTGCGSTAGPGRAPWMPKPPGRCPGPPGLENIHRAVQCPPNHAPRPERPPCPTS